MKKITLIIAFLALVSFGFADGYSIGDKAADFRLMNVDGTMVSMADYPDAKGFILMFSCNHCPYSVAYEDRKIALDNKFAPLGYPVIIINPNDSTMVPGDSFSNMKIRARDKKFPFPYLLDAEQTVFQTYGATRTPHVFLLNREDGDLIVRYIGAIDNNSQDAEAATERYVESAIQNLMEGKEPDPATTRAIGCTIKFRKS
jgi:peroxiredoxin